MARRRGISTGFPIGGGSRRYSRGPSQRQLVIAVVTLVTIAASAADRWYRSRRSPDPVATNPPPVASASTAPSYPVPESTSAPPEPAVDYPTPAAEDRARFDRHTAIVRRVVDGDTIDVDVENGQRDVKVRLLGIDTPEKHGTSANFGQQATNYTTARTLGKRVTLKLDEPPAKPREKYGRLLAYVYLENGEMLNDSLVRDGMAFAYRTLDCDFLSQFIADENAARDARRGLWKTITMEQMPAWRQRWMKSKGMTQP